MPGLAVLWTRTAQISRILSLVAFFGLLALSFLTTADVLLRWLLDQPIRGVNDITTMAMAIVIAACMPSNLAARQNITIDFLGQLLGGRARATLNAFGSMVTFVFVAVMTYQLMLYAKDLIASHQTTAVLKLPIGYAWAIATALIAFSVPVQAMVFLTDIFAPEESAHEGEESGAAI